MKIQRGFAHASDDFRLHPRNAQPHLYMYLHSYQFTWVD